MRRNESTVSSNHTNAENTGLDRYSPVRLDDCFPSSGASVHTAHAIEWSAHNVLAVVNQWSVQFHIHSLQAPAAVVYPTHITRASASVKRERQDNDGSGDDDNDDDGENEGTGPSSQIRPSGKKMGGVLPSSSTTSAAPLDVVVAGKWATGILPQPHHPVAARFAMLTASGVRLAVYTVARHGERDVHCSAPVMCCCLADRDAKSEPRVKRESRTSENETLSGRPTMNRSRATRILDFLWMARDMVVVVTTAGVHLLALPEHNVSEGSENVAVIPPCEIAFADNTRAGLGEVAPLPSAICRVEGFSSRVVGSEGINGEGGAADTGPFEEMIALASPALVLLCAVHHGDAPRVYVQRIVQTPQLLAIPSAIGATVLATPTTSPSASSASYSIALYVATPFAVTLGTVSTQLHTSVEVGEWTLRCAWGANDVRSEPSVRAFHMFALPPSTQEAGSVPKESSRGTLEDAAVIAVGKGSLLGFIGGEVCVSLFRCHNVDRVAVWPSDAMSAVSGIAVHRSLSMAVMLLQYGRRYSRFLQLSPVGASADNEWSPLNLLLEAALRLRRARTRVLDSVSAADIWLSQHPRSSFEFEELLRDHVGSISLSTYHRQMAIIAGRQRLTGRKEEGTCVVILNLCDACRSEYLHYKREFGIEMYLRFPQPNAAWRVALSRFASLSHDLASMRCECVLSNAIIGAMRWFDSLDEKMNPSNFSVRGALEYISLYCAEAKAQEAWSDTAAESSGHITLWTTPSFTDMLQEFAQLAWKKLQGPEGVPPRQRFTCSLCSRPNSAHMTLSLVSYADDDEHTAIMEAEGRHCTLFCPLRFIPIAMYDDMGTESRCLRCGQHCRTTSALCALCGGMLM